MSLNHEDLKGTISTEVTVDEYEPKAGGVKDVIVVSFYLTDVDPAEDLNTFIQRSYVKIMTSEVSSNTDDDGNYVVFVEFARNVDFIEQFGQLLRDVSRVAGQMEWEITTYLGGDRVFSAGDPLLATYIALTPETYVKREDFVEPDDTGADIIKEFFQAVAPDQMQVCDGHLDIRSGGRRLVAEVVAVGDHDHVIEHMHMGGAAYGVGQMLYEGRVLESIMVGMQVIPFGDLYMVCDSQDRIALLRNTRLEH